MRKERAMAESAHLQTILLNRGDIAALLSPADCFAAVERAFRATREGRARAPQPMAIEAVDGAFHVKGAFFEGERAYVAVKINGNFPLNPERAALPTIQGALFLCDATNGAPLAIMDSIEITLLRTAAASAVAAKSLARPDSSILAICGCGVQGYAHARALSEIFRFERAFAWDKDSARAAAFAADMTAQLGIAFAAAPSLPDAASTADIVVTCTTARVPFLAETHVKPGAFIAAVGADNPAKSEIAPSLMARARIVVDSLDQCLVMGDLHHAVAAGAMRRENVHAELADVLIGAASGRTSAEDIVVFDSTGIAIQDVTSAALVYERALERGAARTFSFAAASP
jgi:ornithine cyclodeaminase/alanine dehydrogenase-like protein (mu-crystallin family)